MIYEMTLFVKNTADDLENDQNYPCESYFNLPTIAYKCSYLLGEDKYSTDYRLWDQIILKYDIAKTYKHEQYIEGKINAAS